MSLPPNRRPLRLALVFVPVVVVVSVLGFRLGASRHAGVRPMAGVQTLASETRLPTPVVQARPDFQKLKGRWVRPDGGYVVDVKDIDAGGKMDASYFNPRSIHIAQAQASQDGTATKVFIELRDVNYPGSTYNLVYNPQEDRLEGIYYQALLQESFEVVFLRAN